MSTTTSTVTIPQTRFRKSVWLLLGLLLFSVLAAGIYGLTWWAGHRSLKEAIANAAKDGPWTLEDLEAARPVMPDAENAVLHARAAYALLPRQWPAWPVDRVSSDPQQLQEDRSEIDNYLSSLAQRPRNQVASIPLKSLGTLLQRDRVALEKARALLQYKRGRFPLAFTSDFVGTLLPHLQELRELAQLLLHDATYKAQAAQDYDSALESLRGAIHCSKIIGPEGTWVSQLVRVAIESFVVHRLEWVLGQGEPSEKSLASFQAELQEIEAELLALYAARGERAGMDRCSIWMQQTLSYTAFRNFAATLGKLSGASTPVGSSPNVLAEELELLSAYSSLRTQRAALLRYMNGLVEVAKLPVEEQLAAGNRFAEQWRSAPLFVRLLGPAQLKILVSYVRQKARLRVAITMLAVERYRKAHGGWPEQLSALVPQYLRELLRDPFDGQPLRYRVTGDMVTVYSIGEDKIDQGGQVQWEDVKQPPDLGMRLWLPAARRQPALLFKLPEHAPISENDAMLPGSEAKKP